MHMSKSNVFETLSKETDGWLSEIVGRVNSNRVNARVMNCVEAKFHVHERSDEFFLVVSGEVELDIEDRTIILREGETYTVSAGLKHRARATGRAELITVISENA